MLTPMPMPTPTTTIMDKRVTGNSTAVSCANRGGAQLERGPQFKTIPCIVLLIVLELSVVSFSHIQLIIVQSNVKVQVWQGPEVLPPLVKAVSLLYILQLNFNAHRESFHSMVIHELKISRPLFYPPLNDY